MFCHSFFSDFGLQIAHGDSADLREERTVDWHRDVEAEGHTYGLKKDFGHAEALGHQFGLGEESVPKGRNKENWGDVGQA